MSLWAFVCLLHIHDWPALCFFPILLPDILINILCSSLWRQRTSKQLVRAAQVCCYTNKEGRRQSCLSFPRSPKGQKVQVEKSYFWTTNNNAVLWWKTVITRGLDWACFYWHSVQACVAEKGITEGITFLFCSQQLMQHFDFIISQVLQRSNA